MWGGVCVCVCVCAYSSTDVLPKLYLTLRMSMTYSYTPRTLRAYCSQSKFRILKIRESSARALVLYNCTPNISRSGDASVSVA